MGKILVKRFDELDEVVSVSGHVSDVVTLEIVLRGNFLP